MRLHTSIAIAFLVATPAMGNVINVPSLLAPTLQRAVDIALENDTIVVRPGTYSGFHLDRDISIQVRSEDPERESVLASTVITSPVTIEHNHGVVKLAGLTFSAPGVRGLEVRQSTVSVRRCAFVGNGNAFLASGAAVRLELSPASGLPEPTFTDCIFIDNRAERAGAVEVYGSRASFDRCEFIGNQAEEEAGAVLVRPAEGQAIASFLECSFIANSASGDGGALFGQASEWAPVLLYIERCSIMGNRGVGGGIAFHASHSASSLEIIDSLIRSNIAETGVGGGLLFDLGEDGAGTSISIAGTLFCGNVPNQISPPPMPGLVPMSAYCEASSPMSGPGPCLADLDGSGHVGFDDLALLLGHWGACPGS